MKLVKLLVAAVVVIVAITKGLPWIRQQLETPSSGSSGEGSGAAATCVHHAASAFDSVGEEIRRVARPPYDAEGWSSARGRLDRALGDAGAACRCADPGCDEGERAIAAMRRLVDDFESGLRGERLALPTAELGEVDELLDEARRRSRG